MRLIATMGASGIKNIHTYEINGKEYESRLSFLALAKAFNINDIFVIGTIKSKESIEDILKENKNIKMVAIESNNVEDVFQKSLEYIGKNTILDLTQGYRHYPMLTLLASIFLQNDSTKNIKDIYYSQIIDENCQAYKESCKYKFTSLLKYLDIANMSRIINTFNKTLLTLDYDVHNDNFNKIKSFLKELTQELFSNNFKKSRQKAVGIEKNIDRILGDNDLDIIKNHLNKLKEEMKNIQKLNSNQESETLLNVSEYFLDKGILLHSATLLYESMVAFLDENVKYRQCNTINKNGKEREANTFERRNCLKKNMQECDKSEYKNSVSKCKEFSKLLRKIDILRNNSAHGHTTGTYKENLEPELKKIILFLSPIIGQATPVQVVNKNANTKIMPNGDSREVKNFQKKKEKVVQTQEDKDNLKDLGNNLAEKFNKR